MADCWIALTTLSSREQAGQLAEALVAERLAACVNVLGPVASIYRWEGKVACDEEVLLLIKTTEAGVAPLKTRVLELHPYDTPEFLAFEVGAGAPDYLAWVVSSVAEPGTIRLTAESPGLETASVEITAAEAPSRRRVP